MQQLRNFSIGPWRVWPERNLLTRAGDEVRLNTRTMDVLFHLADRAGEVVSRDEFGAAVWGDVVVTDDALTHCISELRQALGDSAASPKYIETIPKRGYRLIAPVRPSTAGPATAPDPAERAEPDIAATKTRPNWRTALTTAPVLLIVLAGLVLFLLLEQHKDSSPPAGSSDSIAILPLMALAEEGDLPLAEGLHHDLLTRLSETEGLRVISATSVQRYRGTMLGIPEIAAQLGVDWVVEGSVQRKGNRFRVNVQLIEAASDTHLWARTYEDELTVERLFQAQTEIIEDIADSIESALLPDRQAVLKPTERLEAYGLVVRGRILLDQRSENTMRAAGRLFRQATQLDDSYAEAWALHGYSRFLLHYYGHDTGERHLAEARHAARTALAIEPELGFGLAVKGLIALHLERDLPSALEFLRQAQKRSPAHDGWLAWLEAVAGDLERGLVLTREQARSSPFSPGVLLSLAKLELCAGNAAEALALARQAGELSPAYATAWRQQGQALLVLARAEEAIAAFRQAMSIDAEQPGAFDKAWLALAMARHGVPDEGLEEAVLAEQDVLAQALIHVARQQSEAALAALQQVGWDDVSTLIVRFHPVFEPVRELPGFSVLQAELDHWWGLHRDGGRS